MRPPSAAWGDCHCERDTGQGVLRPTAACMAPSSWTIPDWSPHPTSSEIPDPHLRGQARCQAGSRGGHALQDEVLEDRCVPHLQAAWGQREAAEVGSWVSQRPEATAGLRDRNMAAAHHGNGIMAWHSGMMLVGQAHRMMNQVDDPARPRGEAQNGRLVYITRHCRLA